MAEETLESRLNKNREETLQNTKDYLKKTTNDVDFEDKRAALVKQALTPKSGENFYTNAIDKTLEANDARNHISWVAGGTIHADGTRDLIRDARSAITTKTEQPEKYIAQYLNLCRAAERVVELDPLISEENKISAKDQIKKSAIDVLEGLDKKTISNPEQVNVKARTALLVATLETAGVKKAAKTLSMAKDFQFEDDHKHITTLSTQKDSTGVDRVVSESSVMALGTIPEIQAMYDAIKTAKETKSPVPESVEVGKEMHSMDWYHKASPEVQSQINANIDSIAKGNKVLMNQLIDVLPGAKNCYDKTTCVFNTEKEIDRQMTTMHSGAPSFHGKGDQKELTRLQVRQLNAFSEGGVDINTLNSKIRITEKIERNIEGYVKDAVKKEGKGNVSVQPFNVLRHFTPRDNTALNQTLGEVAKVVSAKSQNASKDDKSKLENLASFLKERPSFFGRIAESVKSTIGIQTKAEKAKEGLDIIKLKDSKLGESLEHAYNAAKLIDSISFLDRNNKSSKVSSEMAVVTSDGTSGILKETAKDLGVEIAVRKTLTHCKSGIDRTGTVMTHATHIMVNEALGLSESKMQADPSLKDLALKNLVKQTAAGHTGAISGSQGGTIGCAGVKPETSHEFSRDVFGKASEKTDDLTVNPAQLLSRASAKGNKGAPDKKVLHAIEKLSPEKRHEAVKEIIAHKMAKITLTTDRETNPKTQSSQAPEQKQTSTPTVDTKAPEQKQTSTPTVETKASEQKQTSTHTVDTKAPEQKVQSSQNPEQKESRSPNQLVQNMRQGLVVAAEKNSSANTPAATATRGQQKGNERA